MTVPLESVWVPAPHSSVLAPPLEPAQAVGPQGSDYMWPVSSGKNGGQVRKQQVWSFVESEELSTETEEANRRQW